MRKIVLASLAVAGIALLPRVARATNVAEFPDNGSEQLGRGGAWVARASDPLAAFFNPAGLAGQDTRITLQSNLTFQRTCFTRVRSSLDTTQEPLAPNPGDAFPRVCDDIHMAPNPQLGFTYKVSDRVGLGFAFIGPSAVGTRTWPEFVNGQPAPQRYMLLKQDGIVVHPSLGVGVEVTDNLRLGAAFQWGFASFIFKNAAAALNTDNAQPQSNDIKATLQVKDLFVPGFTLGALWTATEWLDIAAWYRWSDSIRARGDVGTAANYFTSNVARGDESRVKYGDTYFDDCGTGDPIDTCKGGEKGTVKYAIPMEAKLGFRYHQPRENIKQEHRRDPMKTDVFDLELDVTWANNKASDILEIRFPGDQYNGIVPVAGIPGGTIPPNADVKHGFKDAFGFRFGGDWNVMPDQLALRAGTFFETKAQNPEFQNIDFAGGWKLGLALGGTYRIRLNEERGNALELMWGYAHVFVGNMENTNPDARGLQGLAGTACNPAAGDAGKDAAACAPNANFDGSPQFQKYRTNWPVNLGTITNAINVINVGVAYRF
jgi:long-chain fatty acid transport protein